MKYGLIGRKLTHSLSPLIHSKTGAVPYELKEIEPEYIEQFFKERDFDAINVTIPYKKDAYRACDELSELAQRIGSVNTVVKREDGTLYGDNTDYYGLRCIFEKNGIDPKGKKALILGTGGSSLAARAVLEDLGAAQIINVSRSGEDNYSNLERHVDASVIVNTTPVGMYPDKIKDSPLDLAVFPHLEGVVDLIYNPLNTKLVLQARSLGIKADGGITMLIRQGFRAAERFLNVTYIEEQMQNAENEIISEIENIVLVGMPGCGKSTVGKALASKLGKKFLDTDELVEKKYGKRIPQIFEEKDEEYFRNLESEAVFEASIQRGAVIATGGGAVLREENRRYLSQNGKIVFLNRDITKLSTNGRPLSKNAEALEEMFKIRLPLYRGMCSAEISVKDGIGETVKKILGQ